MNQNLFNNILDQVVEISKEVFIMSNKKTLTIEEFTYFVNKSKTQFHHEMNEKPQKNKKTEKNNLPKDLDNTCIGKTKNGKPCKSKKSSKGPNPMLCSVHNKTEMKEKENVKSKSTVSKDSDTESILSIKKEKDEESDFLEEDTKESIQKNDSIISYDTETDMFGDDDEDC